MALASAGHAESLKPIFDGKSFSGWKQEGLEKFEIVDGVIHGSNDKGGHGWLCTEKNYADFILELEVKISGGNAGIQIRSHFEKQMVGYQIEVDGSRRAWSGGLYEQGRRGWLQNLTNNPAARAAFRTNDWNHYRIRCEGDHIQSWVNGVQAADYHDSMDLSGVIALQVHSGTNANVAWKNIRLQEIGSHSWRRLWDGKSMRGLDAEGAGVWQIEGTALVGKHRAESSAGTLSFKTGLPFRIHYQAVNGTPVLQCDGLDVFLKPVFIPSLSMVGSAETKAMVKMENTDAMKRAYRNTGTNSVTVSMGTGQTFYDLNGRRVLEIEARDKSRNRVSVQLPAHAESEVTIHAIEVLVKNR